TNGVSALVTLDGQGGSDAYNVNLIGDITASLVNVFDSGLGNDGGDKIVITGTGLPDLFLLRAAAAQTGLAFVALLNHDGTKDADHQPFERINYDINLESITVNSIGGDDQFYIDDTRASITINAGDGNDFFQIGQLYQTRRTTEEAGAAERDFVVTPHGVFGAGLHVDFVNIELLQVDGAEGDDRFFILGTSPDIVTEISGGLGTDLFSVNGPTPANGVISNDLRGHSGILTHDVISSDLTYNGLKVVGISANVADNDEPAVIVTETGGRSMVVQGDTGGLTLQQALDRHLVDSYTVVLSRPPLNSSEVHISIDPPPGLVFVDKLLNEQRKADGSAKPLSLTFAGLDWYKAHTVYFKVDADPSIVEIPD